MNSHRARIRDLRADLRFRFLRIDVRSGLTLGRIEKPVCIDERFAVRERPPANRRPFARQREMEAEVLGAGMFVGPMRRCREARGRNHDACRRDEAGRERIDRRGVDRMRDAEIVAVDDEQFLLSIGARRQRRDNQGGDEELRHQRLGTNNAPIAAMAIASSMRIRASSVGTVIGETGSTDCSRSSPLSVNGPLPG